MELCRQLGCEPYINANSAAAQCRDEPMGEYLTFDGVSPMADKARKRRMEPWRVKYWGRQWKTGLRRQHASGILRRPIPPVSDLLPQLRGNRLYKIACGANAMTMTDGQSASDRRRYWTQSPALLYRPRLVAAQRAAQRHLPGKNYRTLEKRSKWSPLAITSDNGMPTLRADRSDCGRIGRLVT
jgi:hypothetical protein